MSENAVCRMTARGAQAAQAAVGRERGEGAQRRREEGEEEQQRHVHARPDPCTHARWARALVAPLSP